MTAVEPSRPNIAPFPTSFTPYGATAVPPEGAKARAIAAAKAGIRIGATATASERALPEFLIVGTKRGGTTSLYNYVLSHPDVAPLVPTRQKLKGAYFFDVNFDRGERWYRSHFALRRTMEQQSAKTGRRAITGEATPYYLYHPAAAQRAAATVPLAKIIILLRDPVERAYSHYKERWRQGVEPLPFADAIEAEAGRLAGETERLLTDPSYRSIAHQMFSYVDQGRYLDGLKRWQEHFPAEQILILRSEDLYEDPAATVTRTQEFLGLKPVDAGPYKAWNKHAAAEMDDYLRHRLVEALSADVKALEAHLDRPMDWSV